MKTFLILSLLKYVILICIIVYGIFAANNEAVKLYEQAEEKAKKENRKLLVLGNPYTASGKMVTMFTKTYGCGDTCIDMNGCGSCENAISDKVENVLNKFGSNEYVIFESGLLEVVDEDKLDYIVNELYRIAGSKENIYGRHYIQNHKTYYNYFGKHAYSLLGEGKISRFVDECPPFKHYKFEKI